MADSPKDRRTDRFDQRLDEAYRQAEYLVGGVPLQVGHSSEEFDRWLHARGHTTFAVITAFNPRSRATDAATNGRRQAELEAWLTQRGVDFVPAIGRDPKGDWADEPGVCLLDPPPGVAHAAGRKFRQNAILEGMQGGVPLLVWL